MRKDLLFHGNDKDIVELEPFGRMQGHQCHLVFMVGYSIRITYEGHLLKKAFHSVAINVLTIHFGSVRNEFINVSLNALVRRLCLTGGKVFDIVGFRDQLLDHDRKRSSRQMHQLVIKGQKLPSTRGSFLAHQPMLNHGTQCN